MLVKESRDELRDTGVNMVCVAIVTVVIVAIPKTELGAVTIPPRVHPSAPAPSESKSMIHRYIPAATDAT
jgi:hypothetical protein